MGNGTPVTAARTPLQSATRRRKLWTECPTCDGVIRYDISRCPHCDAHTRRAWWPSWPVVGGSLLIAVMIAVRRWIASSRSDET